MSNVKNLFLGVGIVAIATLSACSSSSSSDTVSLTQSGLNPEDFDAMVSGKKTELIVL